MAILADFLLFNDDGGNAIRKLVAAIVAVWFTVAVEAIHYAFARFAGEIFWTAC